MDILVVEDHPIFGAALKQTLLSLFEKAHCTVVTSGRLALEAVDRTPTVDIVLVDLKLPDLPGQEFIRAARQRGLRTKIIVLSATDDPAMMEEARAAGADLCLSKSVSATELKDSIELLMSGIHPIELGSTAPAAEPVLAVSARVVSVLKLLALGLSNKEIALTLGISEPTVKSHLGKAFKSLGVRNRTQCLVRAREEGWIE